MKSRFFKFFIVLCLFTLFLFITIKSYASSVSSDLEDNIFRLHILANSDSEDDQELKLKVRDAILEYMENITENCETKSEVILETEENLIELYEIANNVIEENGYDYSVNIEIGNYYFPTKYYGNITLPCGYYDSVKIEIGEAEGQNWWCSLFPPLCFTDISSGVIDEEADENLQENLDEDSYGIITSSSGSYKLKFKLLELFM